MSQPGNEARITNLEKEAMTLGARIEEAAADSAEELKAIRQDIKQLDLDIKDSYKSIGDTFIALGEDLDTVMATMATKEDLSSLEARMDSKLSAMEGRINGNIAAMETRLVDTIKQLWQQRPSE